MRAPQRCAGIFGGIFLQPRDRADFAWLLYSQSSMVDSQEIIVRLPAVSFLFLILLFLPAAVGADEAEQVVMPEVLPPLPIWQGNKLTPEQPFPARVKAISGSWVGYTLLLEEITEEKPGRACLAVIGYQQIAYHEYAPPECLKRMKHSRMHATFFDAPAEVNRFRWDNGLYKLGHVAGREDSLRQWYLALNQGAADDSSTQRRRSPGNRRSDSR